MSSLIQNERLRFHFVFNFSNSSCTAIEWMHGTSTPGSHVSCLQSTFLWMRYRAISMTAVYAYKIAAAEAASNAYWIIDLLCSLLCHIFVVFSLSKNSNRFTNKTKQIYQQSNICACTRCSKHVSHLVRFTLIEAIDAFRQMFQTKLAEINVPNRRENSMCSGV